MVSAITVVVLGLGFAVPSGGPTRATRPPKARSHRVAKRPRLPKPPPAALAETVAALRAIGAGTSSCKTLRARYHDGDKAAGETIVRISGRYGRAARTEGAEAEALEFRGRIPRGLCAQIARNAVDGMLWRAHSRRRTGAQDETRVRVAVGVAGLPMIRVSMWDYDIQNTPGFAIARSQLLFAARALSHREILY